MQLPAAARSPEVRGHDACTLLASGDAGNLNGTPQRGERTCDYTFDSSTVKQVTHGLALKALERLPK